MGRIQAVATDSRWLQTDSFDSIVWQIENLSAMKNKAICFLFRFQVYFYLKQTSLSPPIVPLSELPGMPAYAER